MARRVFFSFHYQKDCWRAGQVRNSWLTHHGKANSFLDVAEWEAVRRKGESAVKKWIDSQLKGTGVTVVLIGEKTAVRPFVQYEIEKSFERGSGLLGIYIHRIKHSDRTASRKGRNPLDDFSAEVAHPFLGFLGWKTEKRYSEIFQTFDWVNDNGRTNLVNWIEEAALRAKHL